MALKNQKIKTVTHLFTTELYGDTGQTGKNNLHVVQLWREC